MKITKNVWLMMGVVSLASLTSCRNDHEFFSAEQAILRSNAFVKSGRGLASVLNADSSKEVATRIELNHRFSPVPVRRLFIEDAQRPILSIEGQSPAILANPTFPLAASALSTPQIPFKVAAIELAKSGLEKMSHSASLRLSLEELTKRVAHWSTEALTARLCDDTARNGLCSDKPERQQISTAEINLTAGEIPSTLLFEAFTKTKLEPLGAAALKAKHLLVLDLGGRGIALTDGPNGVLFSLEAQMAPSRLAWTAAGSGGAFLVLDKNKNGKVESGELVSSFEILNDLDMAHQGVLSASNPNWNSLYVWVDKNHNGQADEGEMMSLSKAGVESINLRAVEAFEADGFGNQTHERSTFIEKLDGKRKPSLIVEVALTSP